MTKSCYYAGCDSEDVTVSALLRGERRFFCEVHESVADVGEDVKVLEGNESGNG